ncbi:hypothetical protein FRC06_011825 [Ceratobasidium sp. 370]|nr:hypothetical protein FRC06_011825 [Ceratobasidium sp. 370]
MEKLSTVCSVITATSAAALAIPGLAGPDSSWVVNALFTAAIGVSLEGLILASRNTVVTSSISDEAPGMIACGELPICGISWRSAQPAAPVMAAPVV